MYSRLLVPLDGSHLAESVLPLVFRFATGHQTTVVLLHVRERHAPSEVHGDRHLTDAGEADAYLRAIAERLRREGIVVEHHCHDAPEGDVARSIAGHADEKTADLIILATHGNGRMRQMLFGSIAQQVLNRGTKPVLLVRPAPVGEAPQFQPETILVPLDATAGSEAALLPAQELALAFGASLHLVMVVATQDTIGGERPSATLLPSATREALELEHQEALDYLEGLASGLRVPGLRVTTEVRRGKPHRALADEASEPGVGLVVVATHGRKGLQAIWAGSVIARLLSRTRAPVLLLRTIED